MTGKSFRQRKILSRGCVGNWAYLMTKQRKLGKLSKFLQLDRHIVAMKVRGGNYP
jgi:hypothetical protein